MRIILRLLLLSMFLTAMPLRAQEPQSRLLATTLGVLAGTAGGGYTSVSIVVLEARFGRYIHNVDDVLGWRSAPFVIGAVTGGVLGFYSPERLQGAVVWGTVGLGAGALVGMGIGSQVWDPPEGRWAGAAIGAGVGLLVGVTIGVANPINLFTDPDDESATSAGIPIAVRIPL